MRYDMQNMVKNRLDRQNEQILIRKIFKIYFYFVEVLQYINFMASLRTHLVDTLNISKYPFFSLVAFLHPFIPQVSNTDDIKKDRKGQTIEYKPSTSTKSFINRIHNLKNESFKTINRLISLNINNFSQLSDKNSNDFKDCQNFIHVLQLKEDDEEQFALSELDTINSMTISADNIHHRMQEIKNRRGQANCGLPTDIQQDFSQVQDL